MGIRANNLYDYLKVYQGYMIINHDYSIIFLQHGNLYVFFILVNLKIQGTIGEVARPSAHLLTCCDMLAKETNYKLKTCNTINLPAYSIRYTDIYRP